MITRDSELFLMTYPYYKESVCHCKKCIDMCLHVPCWGTPEEMRRLIGLGYASKLILDERKWAYGLECVRIIRPEAIDGYYGQCKFLRKNRCLIHAFKPIEGRVGIHDQQNPDIRTQLARLWNSPEGRDVIEYWGQSTRDGFSMSVQGNSSYLYCTPRADVPEWKELEIGYLSQKEELLMDYVEDSNKPTDTVYGYVPIEIVEQVVQKHGGIADKDWRCQYCNSINPKDIYSCSKCGAGLE